MSRSRSITAAVAAAAALLTVAIVETDDGGTARLAVDGVARATPSPSAADPLRVPFSEAFEPYPFHLDAPPLDRTPLDGSYVRIVSLEELGGPVVGVPMHCRRCVPYEVDPGLETLTLHRGRFFLEHQLTGRRGLGHYVVEGNEVRFFNDPNCSRMVGTYRWRVRARTLSLIAVADPCPFGTEPTALDHRARDLAYSDWSKVRVCTAQIETWWPALFACAEPGSRVVLTTGIVRPPTDLARAPMR